jgi:dolichol-phosphate mannosyltransferase
MHRFLPALFRQQGMSVAEMPVGHRARLKGRSKYGNLARLVRGLVDLAGVAWLSRRAIRFRPEAHSAESARSRAQRLR